MKNSMGQHQKIAILTGVSGQDGSYLAELLLEKGYRVIGIKRRVSHLGSHERLARIYDNPNFKLVYGNMHDASSIFSIINKYKPDEFYHLAAQSHVRVSFEVTEETLDTVAKSTLIILNAIKEVSPHTKFYQASSSEMYGIAPMPEEGYNETSLMLPASPYACAKLFAHNIVRNYRTAYDLHASSGILFNHECVEYHTPIIVRSSNKVISICRPVDLIPHKRKGRNIQTYEIDGYEIWDGTNWTKLKAITSTKINEKNKEQEVRLIQTRAGVVSVTNHHSLIDNENNKVRADEVKIKDKLAQGNYPPLEPLTVCTPELAELLGLLASDGYVCSDSNRIQFTNNNKEIRQRVANLWHKLFLGYCTEQVGVSGFNNNNSVYQLYLNGVKGIHKWLRNELYNSSGFKKVPNIILNTTKENQKHFIDGYYLGDGLKAGNGLSFKTNSAILAQGLLFLYSNQGISCSVYVEEKNNSKYFLCNLLSNNTTKGNHLKKPKDEIRKISENIECDEWVFDLETESQIFNAGVGKLVIHNSPRRGETFVTRKITMAAARIKLGSDEKLELGNLLAKRDWGFAPDYVQGMWLMLQQEKPDDYVLATGMTHTVQEFLEEVFNIAELPVEKHVTINKRLYRPEEVPVLKGNASKAKEILGWSSSTDIKALAFHMYIEDLKEAKANEK